MPGFQAINIEVEENIENEVDTQKEIQVDNALKHFQTALKLHAQGPNAYDEAEKAYEELFKSEIFSYPEAATEFDRAEREPEQPPSAAATTTHFAPDLPITSSTDADSVATSLPQALYLAHKNRGQLVVDRLCHDARSRKTDREEFFLRDDVRDRAHSALVEFCSALDRDPSDAELWRRAARVAAFLKSARTSRYCLEAAIELDDDPAVLEVQPPSLVEGLAGEQLKNQLRLLSDDIALSHPIMKPWVEREVPGLIKRLLDPVPFLPDPSKKLDGSRADCDKLLREKVVISVSSPSWTEVGTALVQFAADHGMSGDAIALQVPGLPEDEPDAHMSHYSEHADSPSAQLNAEAATPEDIAPTVPESDATAPPDGTLKTEETSGKGRRTSLPTRKRSQSAAGVGDAPEEDNTVEKRSKRIRRRDAAAAEETVDPNALYASKIAEFQAADKNLFQMTKDILENLGVTESAALKSLSEALEACDSDDRLSKFSSLAASDLRAALTSFNEATAKVLSSTKGQPSLSLSSFLDHAKGSSQKAPSIPAFDDALDLKPFVTSVDSGWLTIQDVAYNWLLCLTPSYLTSKWSEDMKAAVVQLINKFDGHIYHRVAEEMTTTDRADAGSESDTLASLVQMLFELHLDVYERITNANSIVEHSVRVETQGRLERWQDLASAAHRMSPRPATDSLCLRFIWASIFSTALLEPQVRRDHILQCYTSFRDLMVAGNCAQIPLPNNAVIPLVAPAAADREISKLTTMDFFLGLFQDDMDPLSVIESLEPVLNPSSVFVKAHEVSESPNPSTPQEGRGEISIKDCASQGLLDLWKFLQSSSTDLRLFLWSRLSEAYGEIKYTTKQFSCRLRSIEMIVSDLSSDTYLKTPDESRGALFMKLLRSLDELLIQALTLALNEPTSFDIIDEEHLRTTSAALASVNCLLHTAAICEDEMRIADTLPSPTSTSALNQLLNKLREMQVRAWSLHYTVLKAGITLNKDVFPNPDNDLAEFLAAVHQVLGIRKFCKASNKIFLKMMRLALLKLHTIENWEDYLGQVLFDLHGLKLGVGMWEVEDHQCPPEKLEKRTAMQLVDRITVLASRMPIKELLKSDLKFTIERMQQTMGQTKSTPQMIHNLRNFTEFLKKPIHPLRLYQATKGNVTLDAVNVNTSESAMARSGWFFLLGMIALTKFKGVDLNRRQTPGATDDLRIGATFLRLQLQFTPGKWDAWFRLAECFDYELDEAVLWTADKMNKDRAELVKLQRSAIHCYTLALSNSRELVAGNREGSEDADADADALYEMYHGFGMRLYSSSREPFAMEAFRHGELKRFFIAEAADGGPGTYQRTLHEEMSEFQVWKFAAFLFRKAAALRPKDWRNPYMYSKCLWKMYKAQGGAGHITLAKLVDSLKEAAAVAAAMPKSRHNEPVLEPHYKILSIMHKLVLRGDIPGREAADILSEQRFGVSYGDSVDMDNSDDWEEYVIRSLRLLRDKDKSNWQHRIIMRHARIIFDHEDGEDEDESGGGDGAITEYAKVQARAAFNVLRESMFTKTMVINVWKCVAERAGRHHVYTEQYVRFMVRLLLVVGDRVSLEALLRRIRKKGADFYHFNDLWHTCCLAYVRLLRRTYGVPPAVEDVFKTVAAEELDAHAAEVTEWAVRMAEEAPVVGCLRDAIELKKLNSNLTKVAPIDDLISDCYSMLYLQARLHIKDAGAEVASTAQSPAAMDLDQDGDGAEEKSSGASAGPKTLLSSVLGVPTRPDGEDNRPLGKDDGGDGDDKGGVVDGVTSGAPTAPGSTTGAAEPVPKPRKTGIRRPDILRRAEQVVLRVLDPGNKADSAAGGNGNGAAGGNNGGKSRGVSASSGKNAAAATTTPPDIEDGEDGEDAEAGEGGGSDVEMEDAEDGDKDDGGGDDADDEGPTGADLMSSPLGSIMGDSDLSDVPPETDDEGQGEKEQEGEEEDDEDGEEELEEEEEEEHKVPALLFPNLRRASEMAGTASKSVEAVEAEVRRASE